MRIPYNCSSIGYAACYVEYLGAKGLEVTPAGGLTATGEPGGPFTPNTITYVVKNQSGLAVNYEVTHTAPWLTVTNASGYLAGLATANVTVTVNATANALDVGRYTDTLEFINTTNHRGDTIRLVKLEVGSPVRVYSFPMDTNPGWSLQGQWEYGTPAGQGGSHGSPDPTAGATGSNGFGVNLQGDYTPTYGGPYYLTLGPLDFSGGAGGTLKFQRWLNSDYFPYVRNTIDASADGSNWVNVWTAGTTVMRENAWTLRSYDLPAGATRSAWARGPTPAGTLTTSRCGRLPRRRPTATATAWRTGSTSPAARARMTTRTPCRTCVRSWPVT
jgi:hypothetical protein